MKTIRQRYQHLKKQYPGIILFVRVGDFYEFFGNDAENLSKFLNTSFCISEKDQVSIPYHSIHHLLKKLIKNGYKTAICEQLPNK